MYLTVLLFNTFTEGPRNLRQSGRKGKNKSTPNTCITF